VPEELIGADSLEAGWRALGEGDWRRARIRFEDALRVGETPEALEGLGWAGYCLDDEQLTFDARERAYRLYRARGDRGSAARVAAWLASVSLEFRGERAVADGWLQRARTLLDELEPGPDHGWLALHEADLALAMDEDTTSARRLAARAVELGRKFGIPELEMVGLGLEGRALVSEGNLGDGMRRLDEATAAALAGEAKLLFCVGWACCYLISACEQVRDYDRAGEWCGRVGEFCERHGIGNLLGVCRTHYAAVLIWQGRWEEAESELQSASEWFAASRPPMVGDALVRLAELRRRQGRLDEAEKLWARCEGHSLALLGRASLALDSGPAEEAVELADRFLRRFSGPNRMERCAGLEVAVRANVRLGDLERAGEVLEELRATASQAGTRSLRAAALALGGTLAAACGDHDRARRSFEDALDLLTATDAPFEAARVRVDLAETLAALGRRQAARRELDRALTAFRDLGADHEVARAQAILTRVERAQPSTPAEGRGPLGELSRRELEVLTHVAAGLTNHEIAERLVLSEHTVNRHVANILRKLAVPSRAAAAALAGRHGAG
jgi:LuxR family transcriptional regulator, maltose regulon positive regulatory protein